MLAVIGGGRSGSNLACELMRGNPYFIASEPPEYKGLFLNNLKLPENFLTKCDIVYIPKDSSFDKLFETNPHAKILWTIRHPYDMVLSKLRRGWSIADDATFDGCLQDMYKMFNLFTYLKNNFNEKVEVVRMEDIILNIEQEARRICNWYGIAYTDGMKFPHLRMRHPGKKERYKTLDAGQIELYKQGFMNVYSGFFRDKDIDIERLFINMNYIVSYFSYRIENHEEINNKS